MCTTACKPISCCLPCSEAGASAGQGGASAVGDGGPPTPVTVGGRSGANGSPIQAQRTDCTEVGSAHLTCCGAGSNTDAQTLTLALTGTVSLAGALCALALWAMYLRASHTVETRTDELKPAAPPAVTPPFQVIETRVLTTTHRFGWTRGDIAVAIVAAIILFLSLIGFGLMCYAVRSTH